jgi:hypothetical protein
VSIIWTYVGLTLTYFIMLSAITYGLVITLTELMLL